MRGVNPVLRRVTGATTNPLALSAGSRRTAGQCAHRRTTTHNNAHACAATASAFVAGKKERKKERKKLMLVDKVQRGWDETNTSPVTCHSSQFSSSFFFSFSGLLGTFRVAVF